MLVTWKRLACLVVSLSVTLLGCPSSDRGAGDGGGAGSGAPSGGDLPACKLNVDPTGNGPNGFITDNACSYTLSYEGGSPITGTCNLSTDASDSTKGINLGFKAGTRRDAKPYESFSLTHQAMMGRLGDLVPFEVADMTEAGTHVTVEYFHLSALQVFDAERIQISCGVTVDSDAADGTSLTFKIDEATPVCAAAGGVTAYEVHGSLVGTCLGRFGQVGPGETEKSVTIEVTF